MFSLVMVLAERVWYIPGNEKTTGTQSIQQSIAQQDHRCVVENISIALNYSKFSSPV